MGQNRRHCVVCQDKSRSIHGEIIRLPSFDKQGDSPDVTYEETSTKDSSWNWWENEGKSGKKGAKAGWGKGESGRKGDMTNARTDSFDDDDGSTKKKSWGPAEQARAALKKVSAKNGDWSQLEEPASVAVTSSDEPASSSLAGYSSGRMRWVPKEEV